MDNGMNRDEQLTSLADLKERLSLLKSSGVRAYKDGTLEIVIDPNAGLLDNAKIDELGEQVLARLRAGR